MQTFFLMPQRFPFDRNNKNRKQAKQKGLSCTYSKWNNFSLQNSGALGARTWNGVSLASENVWQNLKHHRQRQQRHRIFHSIRWCARCECVPTPNHRLMWHIVGVRYLHHQFAFTELYRSPSFYIPYYFFSVFIPRDLCAGIIKSYRVVCQTNSFSIFTRGIFSQAFNAHRLRTIYGEASQMNA